MRVYPINLIIENLACAVVGGGKVAERKVAALLEAGAKVTVISPSLTSELLELQVDGRITHLAKEYSQGDIKGYRVVVCATDSETINHLAAEEARADGAIVNVVDTPDECDFIIPAKISRGDLLITVSTGGKSPVLSRRLREELETKYGEEYGVYLDMLSELRDEMKLKLKSVKEREEFWRQALDGKVLTLLSEGHLKEAEAVIRHAISGTRTQS